MEFLSKSKFRQVSGAAPPRWGWLPFLVIAFLSAAALLAWVGSVLGGLPLFLAAALDQLSSFAAVFLAIFLEAAPFLLFGSLGSAVVEEFISRDELARWIPRGRLAGALVGGLIGLFFPVCECGVVPFSRRLMAKGMPTSTGVAVLLAAPAVNPIVIASTLAAYGLGPIFWGRMIFSFIIAVISALVFSWLVPDGGLRIEKRSALVVEPNQDLPAPSMALRDRWERVGLTTADEFFEMGRYLVLGASLAALMQTFIPQSGLISIGKGPILSVLVILVLAVLLSICSTVDAFISLAFV